jgi:hypothetical protein
MAKDLRPPRLAELGYDVELDEVEEVLVALLRGDHTGRAVVRLAQE